MSQTIGQGGGMAALPPRGIGEILGAAFQLYRRYWRTLLVIAAMVVVPLTLLQYGIGHWVRTNGQQLHDQVVVSTSFWAVASASLLAALVGLLLYQVLTGAITTEVAVRDAGELRDPAQPPALLLRGRHPCRQRRSCHLIQRRPQLGHQPQAGSPGPGRPDRCRTARRPLAGPPHLWSPRRTG